MLDKKSKMISIYSAVFVRNIYVFNKCLQIYAQNASRTARRSSDKHVTSFNFFLANDQLEAQFLYFIIRLLESSTCFEQSRAHHQEVKLY